MKPMVIDTIWDICNVQCRIWGIPEVFPKEWIDEAKDETNNS